MPCWLEHGETSGMRAVLFVWLKRAGTQSKLGGFEPREAFTSKEEAEAHGLKLARDWVDSRKDYGALRPGMWRPFAPLFRLRFRHRYRFLRPSHFKR